MKSDQRRDKEPATRVMVSRRNRRRLWESVGFLMRFIKVSEKRKSKKAKPPSMSGDFCGRKVLRRNKSGEKIERGRLQNRADQLSRRKGGDAEREQARKPTIREFSES